MREGGTKSVLVPRGYRESKFAKTYTGSLMKLCCVETVRAPQQSTWFNIVGQNRMGC